MENKAPVFINFRDVIADFICRWYWLILGIILGAVLLGGYGAMRSASQGIIVENNAEALEQRVAETAAALNETQKQEVKDLYLQYRSYVMYQKILQEKYSDYMLDKSWFNGQMYKTIKYLVTLKVKNIRQVLTDCLSQEDYDAISAIVGEESTGLQNGARGRNHVYLSSSAADDTFITTGEESLPDTFIFTEVTVGTGEEKCDAIQEIAEKRVNEAIATLNAAGINADMVKLSEVYRYDVASFLTSYMQNVTTQMRTITDSIATMKINAIDKMSDPEIAYFDALREKDRYYDAVADLSSGVPTDKEQMETEDNTETTTAKFSFLRYFNKKYLILGAVIGLFMAVGLLFLFYLLSEKVQTAEEIPLCYHLPVLNRIALKSKNLIARLKLVYRLRSLDPFLTMEHLAIVTMNVDIVLNRSNAASVYLMLTDENLEKLKALGTGISEQLKKLNGSRQVYCGNPLSDANEMKTLSGADAAILLVQTKKTTRCSLERQYEMCQHYEVPVIGAITLE